MGRGASTQSRSKKVELSSYWQWDTRIVGLGDSVEQDKHLTVLRFDLPNKLSLVLPISEMFDIVNDGKSFIPIFNATRISVEIDLKSLA